MPKKKCSNCTYIRKTKEFWCKCTGNYVKPNDTCDKWEELMKKKFCDKCGCDIVGYTSPFYLEFKIKKIKRNMNFPNTKSKIHLCSNCCGKLNEWIEEGDNADEIH